MQDSPTPSPAVVSAAPSAGLFWFRPWRWLALFGYLGFLTWASLAPAGTFARLPFSLSHADKVFHFFIYGGLVAVARWALIPSFGLRIRFWPVLVGAIAYGALMEVLQMRLVSYGRSFELLDVLANAAGALCFWFLFRSGRRGQSSAA